MLAQAVTGTPGHVNSMARVGRPLPRAVSRRGRCAPGDVFLTNDPWIGTGHLYDFVVVTPMFQQGPRWSRCSPAPATWSTSAASASARTARDVFDEGLYIPMMQARRARPDQRDAAAHRPRQRPRAGPGRGRPLLARRLQRRRRPAPGRDAATSSALDDLDDARPSTSSSRSRARDARADRASCRTAPGATRMRSTASISRSISSPRSPSATTASTSTSPAPRRSRGCGINVPLTYYRRLHGLRRALHRRAATCPTTPARSRVIRVTRARRLHPQRRTPLRRSRPAT